MHKHGKYILFILMLLFCNTMFSKELGLYVDYADEIAAQFIQEMKQTYGLIYTGNGGRMNKGIEEIQISFVLYQKINIDEARELEIKATERLLDLINNNTKIRSHLNHYPFTINNAEVSISMRTADNNRPLDGSVALVFIANNKIYYEKAELVKRKKIPVISTDGKPLPGFMNDQTERMEEELVSLKEEPYEEALKIVKEKPSCLKEKGQK